MWQQFTEKARLAVFFAQQEAMEFGAEKLDTEHLLLGLLHEDDWVAGRVLKGLHFTLDDIREATLLQITPVAFSPTRSNDMGVTPQAKNALDFAVEEAERIGNAYVGTEHLLLGLIREGEGIAGRVFAQLGIRLEPVREFVENLQDRPPA